MGVDDLDRFWRENDCIGIADPHCYVAGCDHNREQRRHTHLDCPNGHTGTVLPGAVIFNSRGDSAARCRVCGVPMRLAPNWIM